MIVFRFWGVHAIDQVIILGTSLLLDLNSRLAFHYWIFLNCILVIFTCICCKCYYAISDCKLSSFEFLDFVISNEVLDEGMSCSNRVILFSRKSFGFLAIFLADGFCFSIF